MRFAILVLATGLGSTAVADSGAALPPATVADSGAALPSATAPAPAGAGGTVEKARNEGVRTVDYGVDLRIRSVHVPTTMLEWFLARGNGAGNLGVGIDFVRRRGNSELQLGLEYERISLGEGVLIGPGESVPADFADYVLGPDSAPEKLGWVTIEFSFIHHTPLHRYIALRYGAGLGLGILTGGLYRWDVECAASATNASPVPGCVPGDHIASGTGRSSADATGAPQTSPAKYDLPPVFPVVNAIAGLQVRPTPKAVINLEFGLRTLPFFGMSAGYFF